MADTQNKAWYQSGESVHDDSINVGTVRDYC